MLRERPDPAPGPGEVLVRTRGDRTELRRSLRPRRATTRARRSRRSFRGWRSRERSRPWARASRTWRRAGASWRSRSSAATRRRSSRRRRTCFPLPDGVDLVEAAAVPVAFLTAWYACARAEVAEGDRVVVTAAAGGVGSALLQVLREKRAKTIALVGSDAKAAACRALGATDVGTYASADALIERAGGRVDVVVDAIGGRIFRRLWRRLGPSGRYVLYGFAAASGASGVAKLTAARELLAMGLFSPYSFVQSLPDADRLQPLAPAGPHGRAPAHGARESSRSGRTAASARSSAPRFDFEQPARRAPRARRPRHDRKGRHRGRLIRFAAFCEVFPCAWTGSRWSARSASTRTR